MPDNRLTNFPIEIVQVNTRELANIFGRVALSHSLPVPCDLVEVKMNALLVLFSYRILNIGFMLYVIKVQDDLYLMF